jgi:phosphatidylinositol alpha-1,6-mannosyltransferase
MTNPSSNETSTKIDWMPGGILLVAEVFPPAIGGSGALLHNIYSRIDVRDVRVLAGSPPAGPSANGVLDVAHIRMDAPDWGIVHPAAFIRHVRVARAIRGLLAESPAVVHCARALPEGLSAAMALRGNCRSLVCWLHGEELGFASTSRELSWLARRVYACATTIFANSRNSKELLVRQWGIDSAKVHVVYPGVDTGRFHTGVDGSSVRARFAGPDEILFVSIGRLQRRKGHDIALKALADVRRTVPHVRYLVAGDGAYRPQLEQLTRELGLTDIVTFAGEVPDGTLPQWYRAADVFLMPNRTDGVDFEGFGIVFLEAAACGLPVIAGKSGGAPEAVLADVTGRVVDGTDVGAVAEAIMALALNPHLRASMGSRGVQRVQTDFTWEIAASRVAALA